MLPDLDRRNPRSLMVKGAWQALAEEFDRRDRIYGAEATRRLALFQQILTDEAEQGTPGPPKVDSPDDM